MYVNVVLSICGHIAVNQLLLYERDTSIRARNKIRMYISLSKRLDAVLFKIHVYPSFGRMEVRLRYKGNRSKKSCRHVVGIIVAEIQEG